MRFIYSLSSRTILDKTKINPLVSIFKKVGITDINIHGYMWGHLDSPIADMVKAREYLLQQGFGVGIISVPVGHPGNAVDPENPEIDLRIPNHWRYKIDKIGKPVQFSADIEDIMIHDNVEIVKQFKEAGFRLIFLDDDLRTGNWGNEIQGCFCDDCIQKFNTQFHLNENRESLSKKIATLNDKSVLKQWVQFQCEKVTQFMKAMAIDGVEIGIMVMHRGDERHGIDITALKQNIPNIHMRVGEAHFQDRDFDPIVGKIFEIAGIQQHLNLMGLERTYSETTVFPTRKLSLENWLYKTKMGIALGIPNIYFMNGIPVLDEDYWQIIVENLDELRDLEQKGLERTYPVHIVCGTHGSKGETIKIPISPYLIGLPVKPVRALEVDGKGDILIWLGNFAITKEWIPQLTRYKHIIIDAGIIRKNITLLNQAKISPIPLTLSLSEKLKSRAMQEIIKAMKIRKLVAQFSPQFPYISEGMNIGLLWLKEGKKVILFNLEANEKQISLKSQDRNIRLTIRPKEFRVVEY